MLRFAERSTVRRSIHALLLALPLMSAMAASAQDPEQAVPPVRRRAPVVPPPPLHVAAADGNFDEVKKLVEGGANVNEVNGQKDTALVIVLRKDRPDIGEYLLDHGADPKIAGQAGDSPLHLAANFGHVELVKRLIDAGASLSALDGKKRMPVHYSAERGIAAVIPLVASRPGIANATDSFGDAPIDLALKIGSEATVLALLDAGGRINNGEEIATRRIDEFVQMKMYDAIVKSLGMMTKAPLLQARLMDRAMTTAVSEGDFELIKRLSESGSIPPSIAREQAFNATDLSSVEILNAVLEHTADVNALRRPGLWAPIHAAALRGDVGIYEALIAKGADPKLVDGLGRTTLHLAALAPGGKLVPILLQAGLSPAATDALGNTPLHYAALEGRIAATKELLAANSPQAPNNEGNTPYDVALANEHEDIAALLTPSQRPPVGYYKFAALLAPNTTPGAVAEARDRWLSLAVHGTPFLHIAVMADSLTVVQELIAQDPKAIRSRDPDGFLALHIAAEHGNAEIIGALLNAGSAVNDQENPSRWSPLHCAAENGNAEAVNALLAKGADAKAVDANGKTPKAVAEELHRQKIAALLP